MMWGGLVIVGVAVVVVDLSGDGGGSGSETGRPEWADEQPLAVSAHRSSVTTKK
jgi:hypothetical protein